MRRTRKTSPSPSVERSRRWCRSSNVTTTSRCSSSASTLRTQRPTDRPGGRSAALGLADVDHPRNAELVDAHAELVTPHLLLQRNGDGAASRQLVPVAVQSGCVVAAEADGDVVP